MGAGLVSGSHLGNVLREAADVEAGWACMSHGRRSKWLGGAWAAEHGMEGQGKLGRGWGESRGGEWFGEGGGEGVVGVGGAGLELEEEDGVLGEVGWGWGGGDGGWWYGLSGGIGVGFVGGGFWIHVGRRWVWGWYLVDEVSKSALGVVGEIRGDMLESGEGSRSGRGGDDLRCSRIGE
ncbi:hypothetical protein Tco_0565878 [Tanacetum coccineum]